MALTEQDQTRHGGGNVKHFRSGSRRVDGMRSYTSVKKRLQQAKRVNKADKARREKRRAVRRM